MANVVRLFFLRAHSAGALYALFLVLIPIVSHLLRAIVRDSVLVRGHQLSVVSTVLLFLGALVFWLLLKARPLSKSLTTFAVVASVLWLYVMVREGATGSGHDFTALILPPALFMFAIKPLAWQEARNAADVFFVALGSLAVLGTTLNLLGFPLTQDFAPSRFIFGSVAPLGEYRWVGLFETTTQASAVGAYLALYGLWRSGFLFKGLAFLGLLILLSGYSRGAFAGIAAALVTILWFKDSLFGVKLRNWARGVATFIVLGAGALYVFLTDPTMSYRTSVWDAYRDYFATGPFFGIGTSGIDSAVTLDIGSGRQEYTFIHAHNIFLDSAVRYGILGLFLSATLLTVAYIIVIKAGRLGLWISPALVTAFTAIQLFDVHINWRYLDYDLMIPIISVILASAYQRSRALERSCVDVRLKRGG